MSINFKSKTEKTCTDVPQEPSCSNLSIPHYDLVKAKSEVASDTIGEVEKVYHHRGLSSDHHHHHQFYSHIGWGSHTCSHHWAARIHKQSHCWASSLWNHWVFTWVAMVKPRTNETPTDHAEIWNQKYVGKINKWLN